MSFLPDMVKKGWTEEEVFVICFESERERNHRRLQAIVCDHHLKQVKEFLLYNELAIWRSENGFDRVMEGEESCFPGHRSPPPTPQEYYARMWCEVNALKEAISMPARTPWQKTAEFVDGLKGKLPDWELDEIKRYVEKRCRREEAQAQMTAKPVGTVQHCSPCMPNPDMPSGECFNLENNEDEMDLELGKLKSSSAVTGLNTPGQQCPPNEGIRETGKTTASGILTAGAGPSRGENISSTERATRMVTVADIPSIAATPSKRRHKTSSEENKQFDPGGRGEKAPPWNAAVPLPFFSWSEAGRLLVCLSGAKLRGFLSVSCMPCVCFPELMFFFSQVKLIPQDVFSRRGQVADVRNRRTSVFSPTTLSEDGEDKQRPV